MTEPKGECYESNNTSLIALNPSHACCIKTVHYSKFTLTKLTLGSFLRQWVDFSWWNLQGDNTASATVILIISDRTTKDFHLKIIILEETTSALVMTRRQLFDLMTGDIHGEVYNKIENFVSVQRQSPFSLSDRFKNQIRSVDSKITNKYLQRH